MKSKSYKGNTSPFLNRLRALFRVLFSRNFILIEVQETTVGGRPARNTRVLCRTDYGTESDLLTLSAAYLRIEKNL